MRRMLAFFLAIAMLVSFSACTGKNEKDKSNLQNNEETLQAEQPDQTKQTDTVLLLG